LLSPLFPGFDLGVLLFGQQCFQPELHITTRECHPLTFRAERNRMPADFAEPQRLHQPARRYIPNSNCLTETAARHKLAVRTERDRGHIVYVSRQRPNLARGGDVPDPDHLVFASRHQKLPVGTVSNRADSGSVALEGLYRAATVHVPKFERSIETSG